MGGWWVGAWVVAGVRVDGAAAGGKKRSVFNPHCGRRRRFIWCLFCGTYECASATTIKSGCEKGGGEEVPVPPILTSSILGLPFRFRVGNGERSITADV